jgi:hypothetical protein
MPRVTIRNRDDEVLREETVRSQPIKRPPVNSGRRDEQRRRQKEDLPDVEAGEARQLESIAEISPPSLTHR